MLKVARVSDLLRKLEAEGSLQELVKAGVVSTTVLSYYEIVKLLEEKAAKRKRARKLTLVSEVAHEFRVEQTTVYRARLLMNKPTAPKFANKGENPNEQNP